MQRLRQQRRYESNTQPSPQQLQQGEQIINLSLIEEEAASQTLSQVGLRVQNLTLAQDSADAHLQQEAQPVDEHDAIYDAPALDRTELGREAKPPTDFFKQFAIPRVDHAAQDVEKSGQDYCGIPQYFRSLPPANPLAVRQTAGIAQSVGIDDHVDNDDYTPLQSEPIVAEPPISELRLTEPSASAAERPLCGSEDQLAESASEDEIENEEQQHGDGESSGGERCWRVADEVRFFAGIAIWGRT